MFAVIAVGGLQQKGSRDVARVAGGIEAEAREEEPRDRAAENMLETVRIGAAEGAHSRAARAGSRRPASMREEDVGEGNAGWKERGDGAKVADPGVQEAFALDAREAKL